MASAPDQSIDLDCGIAHARLVSWLDDELKLPRAGRAWEYHTASSSCSVELARLAPRGFGPVEIERTRLAATGDPSAVESFRQAFILRFASAGG